MSRTTIRLAIAAWLCTAAGAHAEDLVYLRKGSAPNTAVVLHEGHEVVLEVDEPSAVGKLHSVDDEEIVLDRRLTLEEWRVFRKLGKQPPRRLRVHIRKHRQPSPLLVTPQ